LTAYHREWDREANTIPTADGDNLPMINSENLFMRAKLRTISTNCALCHEAVIECEADTSRGWVYRFQA